VDALRHERQSIGYFLAQSLLGYFWGFENPAFPINRGASARICLRSTERRRTHRGVPSGACWGLGACCWSRGGAQGCGWGVGAGGERRSEYGCVRPVYVLVTPAFQSLEIPSSSTCAPVRAPAPSALPKLGRVRLWPSVNRGWQAVTVWPDVHVGAPRPRQVAAPASSPVMHQGRDENQLVFLSLPLSNLSDACSVGHRHLSIGVIGPGFPMTIGRIRHLLSAPCNGCVRSPTC
jgi:hypothetical protein